MAGWTGSVKAPMDAVISEIRSTLDAQLCAEFRPKQPGVKLVTLVLESYYFRVNSNVGLVVMLEETGDYTHISACACGGSSGMIGMDWGAENSLARRLKALLIRRFGAAFAEEKEKEDPEQWPAL